MSAELHSVTPWHRQFWPWFVIALLGSAVTASLVTVWIAVSVAPERVDYAGAQAVDVVADDNGLVFDLGVAPEGGWASQLDVTITSRDGQVEHYTAHLVDPRRFRVNARPRGPGNYSIVIRAPGATASLRGNWAYPAPTWKLRQHDE